MKKLLFPIILLLLSLSATAQSLDIFDANAFIVNGPNKAVVVQKVMDSPEWQAFQEKVWAYSSAKSAEDSDIDDSIAMLNQLIKTAEANGDKAQAEEIRASVAELEANRRQARALGKGITAEALRKELMSFIVGNRLFYSVTLLFNDTAIVREKSWDDAPVNAFGLMDATGKMIVPCHYEEFWSSQWEGHRAPLIMASRALNEDYDKWEVTIFKLNGTPATPQKYTGATGFMLPWRVVGVRFQDGGWGLVDDHCRLLTKRRYDRIDWNENDLIDSSQGRFIYGERGGVNYILSPTDGTEIGTFKMTDDTHEVKYYPGKDPRK